MFVVLKPDVFSLGDLVLINSIKKNYGITDKNVVGVLKISKRHFNFTE